EWVSEKKIPHAVFYAFSTENWRREKSEVEYLLTLFCETVKYLQAENEKRNISVRVIGQRKDFSEPLQKAISELEAMGKNKPAATVVWIALSYGGRAELLTAINLAIAKGESVDENTFTNLLWTAGMPDPDLIIRTGGEQRLSNFLPWQSIYSELFFISTCWPAFTKDEFERILNGYAARERRIGK
ncbi:MAG: polyprenyl diphosphate synthase, partial [Candidatus Magasanikbacteria bacterium]|nr:polyprenyl diphosphate synthase [Candidatus Magasanikbacteria bacterium]